MASSAQFVAPVCMEFLFPIFLLPVVWYCCNERGINTWRVAFSCNSFFIVLHMTFASNRVEPFVFIKVYSRAHVIMHIYRRSDLARIFLTCRKYCPEYPYHSSVRHCNERADTWSTRLSLIARECHTYRKTKLYKRRFKTWRNSDIIWNV